MRIAICDDESYHALSLKKHIDSWASSRNESAEVQCIDSAEWFLSIWTEASFDLLFLDIKMRGMDGLELAERIRNEGSNLSIVFLTSFPQHISKGYDYNALHYLVKPPEIEKIYEVLDRALATVQKESSGTMIITENGGTYCVQYDDIYFFEMIAHYANVNTDDRAYRHRTTKKELMACLPQNFIVCHRSYIVNIDKIDSILSDHLNLSNGTRLAVSRNQRKTLYEAYIRSNMR